MKKSKAQIEYEKKFNRIAKKLHGNQEKQPQKEPEKGLATQQKETKEQRSDIKYDVEQKSNTNKKRQINNLRQMKI